MHDGSIQPVIPGGQLLSASFSSSVHEGPATIPGATSSSGPSTGGIPEAGKEKISISFKQVNRYHQKHFKVWKILKKKAFQFWGKLIENQNPISKFLNMIEIKRFLEQSDSKSTFRPTLLVRENLLNPLVEDFSYKH